MGMAAVCIDNEGYKASLELGKLYRIRPDKEAQAHGLVRVIDESAGGLCLFIRSLSFNESPLSNRASIVASSPLVSLKKPTLIVF